MTRKAAQRIATDRRPLFTTPFNTNEQQLARIDTWRLGLERPLPLTRSEAIRRLIDIGLAAPGEAPPRPRLGPVANIHNYYRAPRSQLRAIDRWAESQPDRPTRMAATRRLIDVALGVI